MASWRASSSVFATSRSAEATTSDSPRSRASGSRLEGVNLAVSPDGTRLACTTGTSTVWILDAATGQRLRQFDGHSQTVTGLAWIDDEHESERELLSVPRELIGEIAHDAEA